jgi:hypothetical protein
MLQAFALVSAALRSRPRRPALRTTRAMALVPATRPGRPCRRRVIYTWEPDQQTGRLSCIWTLDTSADRDS